MQPVQEERSVGELFAELSRETSTLVRKEVELAKTELSSKASDLGRHLGVLAVGGAVAYAGFLVIVMGLAVGLADLIWDWLAFVLVGLLVAVVGYVLVQRGLDALKKAHLAPHETIRTLKEDKEWLQRQI